MVAGDDPQMGCGSGQNSYTVWYRLTATTCGQVQINTFGSSYDTVLAAFAGSCGSLTSVACNDDVGGDRSSEIAFQAESGTTYYIEVAAYGSSGGGQLQLAVAFSAITETVTIPIDVVLLQDETGSMNDDIGTLQGLARAYGTVLRAFLGQAFA